MRSHLLVTNDFPPKVGGIQSYLWELWRRLPASATTVYCTPHDNSVRFDSEQAFRIERSPEPFLIPYPWLARRINRLASDVGAELVILDPALPLGHIGPALDRPYGLVLHGAEVTVPARLPGTSRLLKRTLNGASLVISAGEYALAEAQKCAGRELPAVVVPPGVDTARFGPGTTEQRTQRRDAFGLEEDALVVASVNRLVPRKGMDVLIRASAQVARQFPELTVLIGGSGRETERLTKLIAQTGAPVRLLGRIPDEDVVALYQAADIMAMLCHDRWGGLEQEGFGIVFLEAAACALPQIAGNSGGAAEAVVGGETGLIVEDPQDLTQVCVALESLLKSSEERLRMGSAARNRTVDSFDYDKLAARLEAAIDGATL